MTLQAEVQRLERHLEAERDKLQEFENDLRSTRKVQQRTNKELEQELATQTREIDAYRRELARHRTVDEDNRQQESELEIEARKQIEAHREAVKKSARAEALALQESRHLDKEANMWERTDFMQSLQQVAGQFSDRESETILSRMREVQMETSKVENDSAQVKAEVLKLRTILAAEAKDKVSKEISEEVERAQLEALRRELQQSLEGIVAASASGPPPADALHSLDNAGGAELPSTPKGKGKGKAMVKCPPPPKAALPKAIAAREPKQPNPYVNLHWKVLSEPPAVVPALSDPILMQTAKLVAAVEPSGSASSESEEVVAHRRTELGLPPKENILGNGERPHTVFDEPPDVQELPLSMVDACFRKREAAVKFKLGQTENKAGACHSSLIDSRRLQMMGILLRKHIMAHKGETEEQAVLSLKRAVLRCDSVTVRQEGLSVIRTVLRQHAADGDKVTEFVREHGEEGLDKLEHPVHHRLVYELLKVPQIDERLECMLFESAFVESKQKCNDGLEILCRAIRLLSQKRPLLGKFFVTAHRLGQSLNKDSRVPVAARGFQLAALDTLMKTKSTESPKHNLLHFVLALMSREDAEEIFTPDDIKILGRAKTIKCNTVYQDCMELVQGFYGVHEINMTGNYTSRATGTQVKIERRRKTMCPRDRPTGAEQDEAPVDTDDRFHETIRIFCSSHLDETNKVGKACLSAFQAYKDVAVWFDDVGSVYPPPKDEKDTKLDLMVVLHRLAVSIQSHRQEVIQDGLRELVQATAVDCRADRSISNP